MFGIDKAWNELHQGARLRVPGVFKYTIKYVSPTLLLAMLGWWFVTEWWSMITMKDVPAENIPYVLGIRLALLGLLIVMLVLVYIAWKKKRRRGTADGWEVQS